MLMKRDIKRSDYSSCGKLAGFVGTTQENLIQNRNPKPYFLLRLLAMVRQYICGQGAFEVKGGGYVPKLGFLCVHMG